MEETNTETPVQEKPAAKDRGIKIEITLNGETKTETARFHTPSLLECVKELDDAATVKIVAQGDEERVLLDGTKEQAVAALEASIVKPGQIAEHVQRLIQFLADHSSLRAVSVEAVFVDDEGRDSGFGFVSTVQNCTAAQAISLVNCCEANVDEFVTKAKLTIPGRDKANGGIVTPTQEQVKALG